MVGSVLDRAEAFDYRTTAPGTSIMRILVTSYGTEGDTRPMLALCQGLIHAGHEAIYLGEASGSGLAGSAGVPFAVLAGDIREAINKLISAGASGGPGKMTRSIAALATGHSAEWLQALLENGRDCDAIVFSGLTTYVALSAADHLGIRAIAAGLQPMTPTRDFPSPFWPPLRLPAFCNRLTHRLVTVLFWKAFRESVNAARMAVTAQPARRRVWPDYPVLFGVSPQLVPRPDDWPDLVQLTGDWPLPSGSWTAPDQLAQFLRDGAPPVYIGFGSMIGFDRKHMLGMLAAALNGRRALLSGGWAEFSRSNLPPTMLPIGPLPHERLFPLVSVAVHHGGAGTSHTAARAGVPSVVVPFVGDQFFWANRLQRAGVAPPYVAHRGLNAERLGRAISEADTAGMRARAREIGSRMRAERGVSAAIAAMERLVRGGARQSRSVSTQR